MKDDIILKIKEREILEIVKIISICYLVFLFFFALIIKYQETIIEALLIAVFALIIDSINSGTIEISDKGLTCKVFGFMKYNKIYRLKLKNRVLYLYTRDRQKPYKIIFSITEDIKIIEKAYKLIDSKVKRIEEEDKERKEYVEKFL